MSSTPVVPAGDDGNATRPLPDTPSLEFERKRAKALLRRMRRTDPAAKLADAQFAVARELGFATWPRLVHYFHRLEREIHDGPRGGHSLDIYEGSVRTLLTEHRLGREWAGRSLAAYVPRFYGRSIAEVLAQSITEDDARMAVARQNHCANWEQLAKHVAAATAHRGNLLQQHASPLVSAGRALSAHDVAALATIVDAHPELLTPTADDERRGYSLVNSAVMMERRERTPAARQMTEWLVSRGMNATPAFNHALLGFPNITPEEVEYFLERGADLAWTAPNGMSVLENAILTYMNGAAVDLVALRGRARRALWTAAGLGDVAGVRRYFGRDGRLIAAAYNDRPPFGAMQFSMGLPALPDPDERELLGEVALVAAMNGRVEVIEIFLDRGFPIDYDGWGGTSLLRFAIGQHDVRMVEMLIRRGADLDKKGEWPHASAREFARMMINRQPLHPALPRILALCGAGTVEEARAEAERNRQSPPPFAAVMKSVFELSGDDAARHDQGDIRSDNLFIGLLRGSALPLGVLTAAGADLDKLRASVADRLLPSMDQVARQKLSLTAEAKAIIERAVAIADARRAGIVNSLHLIEALVEDDESSTARLIAASGAKMHELRQSLARV